MRRARALAACTVTVCLTGLATLPVAAGAAPSRAPSSHPAVRASQQPAPAASTLRVATKRLPGAERTRPYRLVLARTGGTAPTRWSLGGGSLPVGLSLSRAGVISGVPRVSGATRATIKVTDARGRVATRTMNLAVAPRGGLILTERRIGPVWLPAPPNGAVTQLTSALGRPATNTSGPGCTIADPAMRARYATWEDLGVFGQAPGADAVRMTSWTVNGRTVPLPLALPYRVGIGSSLATLRARVPGVRVEVDTLFTDGDYMATKGDLLWWLSKKSKTVYRIQAHPEFCE